MPHALVPLRRPGRRPGRAGLTPFGLGQTKPGHFREMLQAAWDNRDNLRYALRVLTHGVCDGCALGTSGLRDWTIDGIHLCSVRLRLLRLNTIGRAPDDAFVDAARLRALDGKQLRGLGRLPYPLRRRRGEPGFRRVSWEEALQDIGARMRKGDPDRMAAFMTSRGLTNEVYYAAQKAFRLLGSPHIDNAARLCHSPSTAAMKRTLGVAASTCSYRDWYEADVIVFFGSNPANDQPVAMKYLYEAKRRGASVLSVNTFREPGMARYWIPSTPDSALFGSEIVDEHFMVQAGGDLAFTQAVQRLIIEQDQVDLPFIEAHTTGFQAYRDGLLALDLNELIARSGASREQVEDFARRVGQARQGVFVWSMGLTQHAHGSDTVAAVCCLGLSRGFVGRNGCGLMPIRGHSGVQGGAEMGAYATVYPGGMPIDEEHGKRLSDLWGFAPPVRVGNDCAAMLRAADAGELDVFYSVGGNLRDTLPQPAEVERALGKVPLRIHQDIVLSHPMLVDPAEAVYVLPAKTRYEHAGGVTETTTERRVIYSPHIPGHEIGEAREEWRIALDIARAARPDLAHKLGCEDAQAIREDIARTIPTYAGIEQLRKRGDQFQYAGRHLCTGGTFPLPGGRARFELREAPDRRLPAGRFHLTTRRGKQFNSIVQADRDPLTGAERDHVLMNGSDMAQLSLAPNQRVRVRSDWGSLQARVFRAEVTAGSVQMHWPEANVLLDAARQDPGGLVPDYNAVVWFEAA